VSRNNITRGRYLSTGPGACLAGNPVTQCVFVTLVDEYLEIRGTWGRGLGDRGYFVVYVWRIYCIWVQSLFFALDILPLVKGQESIPPLVLVIYRHRGGERRTGVLREISFPHLSLEHSTGREGSLGEGGNCAFQAGRVSKPVQYDKTMVGVLCLLNGWRCRSLAVCRARVSPRLATNICRLCPAVKKKKDFCEI